MVPSTMLIRNVWNSIQIIYSQIVIKVMTFLCAQMGKSARGVGIDKTAPMRWCEIWRPASIIATAYLAPKGPLNRTMLIGVTLCSHKYFAHDGICLAGRAVVGGCCGIDPDWSACAMFSAVAAEACMVAPIWAASLSRTSCGEPCSCGGGPNSGGLSGIPADIKQLHFSHVLSKFFPLQGSYLERRESAFPPLQDNEEHSTLQSSRRVSDLATSFSRYQHVFASLLKTQQNDLLPEWQKFDSIILSGTKCFIRRTNRTSETIWSQVSFAFLIIVHFGRELRPIPSQSMWQINSPSFS